MTVFGWNSQCTYTGQTPIQWCYWAWTPLHAWCVFPYPTPSPSPTPTPTPLEDDQGEDNDDQGEDSDDQGSTSGSSSTGSENNRFVYDSTGAADVSPIKAESETSFSQKVNTVHMVLFGLIVAIA